MVTVSLFVLLKDDHFILKLIGFSVNEGEMKILKIRYVFVYSYSNHMQK